MLTTIKHRARAHASRTRPAAEDGQALVEYTMIMALVGMALVVTLTAASSGVEGVVQTIIGVL